ncbi:hypothetical protein BU14_1063s0001 [Porphyra umbilicalis]|uniref:Uncharacterized protein n=1 Tax=Porphyra umbilicalis TaxID=2786 RepID=A0A1X6NMS4_PORUM|nr:hypothetical protein BU14_1063s0001 [Porphyra umbilicalis]|eukprot:OSX69850.1 hypothetical protein BU14_1063s0001 [Porphyra umbilicalis]
MAFLPTPAAVARPAARRATAAATTTRRSAVPAAPSRGGAASLRAASTGVGAAKGGGGGGGGGGKAAADEAPLDERALRAAEIHEVIQGLVDFRARIVDDATVLAKKVKAPRKQLEEALLSHPDIQVIDKHIVELNAELKELGDR